MRVFDELEHSDFRKKSNGTYCYTGELNFNVNSLPKAWQQPYNAGNTRCGAANGHMCPGAGEALAAAIRA